MGKPVRVQISPRAPTQPSKEEYAIMTHASHRGTHHAFAVAALWGYATLSRGDESARPFARRLTKLARRDLVPVNVPEDVD